MWRFFDCLKLEQAITDHKISRHLNRDPPPRREAKWIRYDERLDEVINDYDTYADVMQFLKVVAAMTWVFCFAWVLLQYECYFMLMILFNINYIIVPLILKPIKYKNKLKMIKSIKYKL